MNYITVNDGIKLCAMFTFPIHIICFAPRMLGGIWSGGHYLPKSKL